MLENPSTMAYLLFLNIALPMVNNFNKLMQHHGPVVQRLKQQLDSLIRKLMLRVIKAAKTVSDSSDVTSVDLDDIENFLPLQEVFIGHQTLKYLEDNDSLSITDVRKFR